MSGSSSISCAAKSNTGDTTQKRTVKTKTNRRMAVKKNMKKRLIILKKIKILNILRLYN
jgi:hypothetical protein